MTDGGEARDVIDLEQQRLREHFADTGDPHQALRLRRIEAPDLHLEQVVLCELQQGVQLW